jgi:hypothetical protein
VACIYLRKWVSAGHGFFWLLLPSWQEGKVNMLNNKTFNTISLKYLTRRRLRTREERRKRSRLLDKYFQGLKEAFPLPGEIESRRCFRNYLRNDKTSWDIMAFMEGNEVIGGIHYQIISGGGVKALFGELIWIREDLRHTGRFQLLWDRLLHLSEQCAVDSIVIEVNDPHLMTNEEKEKDQKAGITTQDRLGLWNNVGFRALNVLYAQPALEPKAEAVAYLMFCVLPLRLPGTFWTVEKYIGLVNAYFSTFIDTVENDETYQRILLSLEGLDDDTKLSMVPLMDKRPVLNNPELIKRFGLKVQPDS